MTPDERTVLSALELLDTGTEQPTRVWAFKRIQDRIEALRAEPERLNKELSDALWSNVSLCKEINNKDEQIDLRDEAITRLEAEFDATCNAEELRQVREDNHTLQAEVARLEIENCQQMVSISKLQAEVARLTENPTVAALAEAYKVNTTLRTRISGLETELQGIASVSTTDWDDPADFKAWAQSRARHTLLNNRMDHHAGLANGDPE